MTKFHRKIVGLVYKHTRIYTHTYTLIPKDIFLYTIHTHACIYIYTYTYVYLYTYDNFTCEINTFHLPWGRMHNVAERAGMSLGEKPTYGNQNLIGKNVLLT